MNGAYVYYGYGPERAYELGADFTDINYASGLAYKQQDYTFVYNAYGAARSARYGLHHITSSTGAYDGTVFFAGAGGNREQGRTWQANVYMSQYGNLDPGLTAYQVSLGAGRAKAKSPTSGSFMLTQVHAIKLSGDMPGLDAREFFSVEVSATRYNEKTSVTAFAWGGEQAFGVQNNGFAVFNKPELQKGAYGLTVGLNLGNQSSLKLGWSRELFRETGTGEKSSAAKLSLTLGRTF